MIPKIIVNHSFGIFVKTIEKPSEEEYKFDVFVVHCASVNTSIPGIASPSVIKIFIISSVPIAFDIKIARIIMKLFPQNSENVAMIASFLLLPNVKYPAAPLLLL